MKNVALVWKGTVGFIILFIVMLLASCAEKTQSVTSNKDEPKWVNSKEDAKKVAGSSVVAVASAKVLSGNLNYATNQAAMHARIQIAQMISTKVEQVIRDQSKSGGLSVSENSLQEAKQKVEQSLQKTEIVQRWIDKDSNPQVVYVLVSMDKESFDNVIKAGANALGMEANKAKEFSEAVEYELN